VDDTSTECDRNRLRAIVDLKLGKNISHVLLSLSNPSRRVNVVIFSSRKRFKPFCVPTQMLCSRSSRKHHTRAADSPSNCEYFSIFAIVEICPQPSQSLPKGPDPYVPITVMQHRVDSREV